MSVIILNMTHRHEISAHLQIVCARDGIRRNCSRTKVNQALETDSHRRSGVLNLSCFRWAIFLFRFIYHLFMFSLEIIRHFTSSMFTIKGMRGKKRKIKHCFFSIQQRKKQQMQKQIKPQRKYKTEQKKKLNWNMLNEQVNRLHKKWEMMRFVLLHRKRWLILFDLSI